MALLKDISEICGVSIATVSKALHDNYSDISDETREKVRNAARELDYIAQPRQKGGEKRESGVVCVLTEYAEGKLRREILRQILWGMIRKADQEGYDLLVMPGKNSRKNMSCLGRMVQRAPDGICLLCDREYVNSEEVQEVVRSSFPVLSVSSDAGECSVIRFDDRRAAQSLMDYLALCGHRKFLYLGDASLFSRRAAQYLEEAALEHDFGSFRAVFAGNAVPEDESCIVFDTTAHALRWIKEHEARYRVPEDLSAAALYHEEVPQQQSGQGECAGTPLRITHIFRDPERLGEAAVGNILRFIDDPMSDLKEPIYTPGRLVRGDSVRRLTD